jgi:site-specific DNA recombinase
MTEEVTLPDGRTERRTRLIRGADGLPLQRAEPLISKEDWELASKKLDENTSKRSGSRTGGSPLLRVAFCACDEPVYRAPGHNWPHYRCASRITHKPCSTGNKSISAALLESTVEGEFLRVAGDIEIVRRVFRPGVDHTKDIEEVTRALAELREDREAGLYSSETGKQEYRESYARLDAKREQLMSLPTRPDTWEEIPTGETYRQRWAQLSTDEEKGKELRSAGLRVTVHIEDIPAAYVGDKPLVILDEGKMRQRNGRVEIEFPRDFSDRVRQFTATHG